jgi:large subunit ribosomal protein L9
MQIILLADVPKIGRKGEVKNVSDGFGKNMLIKKGLAIMATKEAQAKLANEAKQNDDSKQKARTKSELQKQELEKRIFAIKVKVGEKGQIFSSVHEKDVAAAIFQKTKIQLEKNQFQPLHGIKTLGEHIITLKLGQGITAKTKINLEAL